VIIVKLTKDKMADAQPSSQPPADDGAQPKSKKPSNTAFKQQRLPAWQPVMTAKSVIPTFFVLGVIFVPLGAVLFDTSNKVQEKIIDYTSAQSCETCYDDLNTTDYQTCQCNVTFTLDQDFPAPVYMYYGLDNFYQNHRRYVKSRDDTQLLGEVIALKDLNKDCKPYRSYNSTDTLPIAPCGAIANSLFNDTLKISQDGIADIPVHKDGIAWPTDKRSKFKNPADWVDKKCQSEAFKDTVKPPNWPVHICDMENGYQNEDLIVWMRTAALPNFRKLYRRIDHSSTPLKDNLPAGNYTLIVGYNYPVKAFDGRKKLILSTVSWMGGRNPFLGIAYMVVGVLCILLALIFLIIHCKIGKSADETVDVTNRTPYLPNQK